MRGFLLGFLRALKLPVKLLRGELKKRRKKSELEEKCRKHVRNFAPGRLKNTSWQKSLGKDKRKKRKVRKLVKK